MLSDEKDTNGFDEFVDLRIDAEKRKKKLMDYLLSKNNLQNLKKIRTFFRFDDFSLFKN